VQVLITVISVCNQGACSKAYPHQKSHGVEEMIAVTLKHAPDRAKTANQASQVHNI